MCWSGSCPAPIQRLLWIGEQLLLIALAAFVLTQSYLYAWRMMSIGRTSDMAGIPMWIPHGTLALGFGLILIVAIWRVLRTAKPGPAGDQAKS